MVIVPLFHKLEFKILLVYEFMSKKKKYLVENDFL